MKLSSVQPIGKVEKICLAAIAIVFLVYMYWHGAIVRLQDVNTDMTRVDQGAYLHSAVTMYEVLFKGDDFRARGSRGPLYPLLVALAYDPDLTEDAYFVRGKYINVVLTLIILAGVFLIFRKLLPFFDSVNLTLVAAFMMYLFIAATFHAEPLFYFLSFCTFVLLCKMLLDPSWKLGILTGFVLGVTYLTKPSVLPAVALFVLFSTAKVVRPLGAGLLKGAHPISRPPIDARAIFARLASIGLVVLVFLATIYPYIRSNKKVFGQYFYCVSTTFYMWYDSWDEVKLGTKAHGDRKGWPDMPPEEIPSLSKYLREHTMQQMVDRMLNGFRILHERQAESYGYYKYVLIYLTFLLTLVIINGRHTIEMAVKYPFLLLFCVSYFAAYLLGYAWYTPIASGTRFTLALFLPIMFATTFGIHAQPTRYLSVWPLGAKITLHDVFNVAILLVLTIDIYFVLTKRILLIR
jgi:hypothetical protein